MGPLKVRNFVGIMKRYPSHLWDVSTPHPRLEEMTNRLRTHLSPSMRRKANLIPLRHRIYWKGLCLSAIVEFLSRIRRQGPRTFVLYPLFIFAVVSIVDSFTFAHVITGRQMDELGGRLAHLIADNRI